MEVLIDVALDANFLELEMSNVLFASQRYTLADVSLPAFPTEIALHQGRWVHLGDEPWSVTQLDLTGRIVQSTQLTPGDELVVPEGFWVWEFRQGKEVHARKTFKL